MKLDRHFYNRDTITVAKELLGKVLVYNDNGIIVSGKIVETEAYRGIMDKAAHAYGGKKTKRVEPMYGEAGHSYIYFIYGLYHCFNVVTEKIGTPEAVLVRALEPIDGIDIMSKKRFNKQVEELTKKEKINLTNGPSKLCSALSLDRNLNKEDLCGEKLYIEDRGYVETNILSSKRVGIDYAEEARDYLWRFYIEGNPYVSGTKKK